MGQDERRATCTAARTRPAGRTRRAHDGRHIRCIANALGKRRGRHAFAERHRRLVLVHATQPAGCVVEVRLRLGHGCQQLARRRRQLQRLTPLACHELELDGHAAIEVHVHIRLHTRKPPTAKGDPPHPRRSPMARQTYRAVALGGHIDGPRKLDKVLATGRRVRSHPQPRQRVRVLVAQRQAHLHKAAAVGGVASAPHRGHAHTPVSTQIVTAAPPHAAARPVTHRK